MATIYFCRTLLIEFSTDFDHAFILTIQTINPQKNFRALPLAACFWCIVSLK